MKVPRHKTGSVRFDRRRKTWNYLYYDGPVRRSKKIGTKQDFPTKAAAWNAVPDLGIQPIKLPTGETVQKIIERYEVERMPSRLSTARVYRSFLKNHIEPKWGAALIQDLQPRAVELWLRDLELSPKSKTHVRSLLHGLVDFAMWAGILEMNRNPMSLVKNKGALKKVRLSRSLTEHQFHAVLKELREPIATLALLSVCLGLRVSEALALQWADVDWKGLRLTVERAIVNQNVDDVKTEGSKKTFDLAPEMVERMRSLRQQSTFSELDDWIFASPVQIGRKPYSYTMVWREMRRASNAAGIGPIGTHTMRHTYRSWLDAVGTKLSVQQKMMRHSDIRTTMNIYGDVVTDEMSSAAIKVSSIAFQRP